VKHTNYKNAIRLNEQKLKQKAHEILYCSNGKVLETTRNNFFMFQGNTLITPKENVLFGITRRVVIDLAKREFPIEERDVCLSEIVQANEAFLTGTNKKILPVVRIDEQAIGNGKPGRNTRLLMQAFDRFVKTY
jgi:D-alanine transaminase/branched-chain amino acid aminotransferase